MKLTIAFILSLGLLAGFYSNTNDQIANIKDQNDLADIKQIADKNDISVTSWMAYTRKKLGHAENYEDMKKQLNETTSKKNDYNWRVVVEEDNQYILQGERSPIQGVVEKLKLKAYAVGKRYEVALTHEAHGEGLGSEQVDWVRKTFKDDKQTFYSITGMIHSTEKLPVIAENLVTASNANTVEQLQEDRFVSVSAHSELFTSELMTSGNEVINMQIGLRTSGDSNVIDVTIGTPIITTEY